MTVVEKVLFLMRAPATAAATTDALARLAAVAREVDLDAGARLFSAGDAPDALALVLDGAVRIDGDGAARVCGRGDVVGALPLFSGGRHTATAITLSATRLLCIDPDDLYELLDEDGELARALFAGVLRELSAATV
jgi:CRP-like cAMP-binding protein